MAKKTGGGGKRTENPPPRTSKPVNRRHLGPEN